MNLRSAPAVFGRVARQSLRWSLVLRSPISGLTSAVGASVLASSLWWTSDRRCRRHRAPRALVAGGGRLGAGTRLTTTRNWRAGRRSRQSGAATSGCLVPAPMAVIERLAADQRLV